MEEKPTVPLDEQVAHEPSLNRNTSPSEEISNVQQSVGFLRESSLESIAESVESYNVYFSVKSRLSIRTDSSDNNQRSEIKDDGVPVVLVKHDDKKHTYDYFTKESLNCNINVFDNANRDIEEIPKKSPDESEDYENSFKYIALNFIWNVYFLFILKTSPCKLVSILITLFLAITTLVMILNDDFKQSVVHGLQQFTNNLTMNDTDDLVVPDMPVNSDDILKGVKLPIQ